MARWTEVTIWPANQQTYAWICLSFGLRYKSIRYLHFWWYSCELFKFPTALSEHPTIANGKKWHLHKIISQCFFFYVFISFNKTSFHEIAPYDEGSLRIWRKESRGCFNLSRWCWTPMSPAGQHGLVTLWRDRLSPLAEKYFFKKTHLMLESKAGCAFSD